MKGAKSSLFCTIQPAHACTALCAARPPAQPCEQPARRHSLVSCPPAGTALWERCEPRISLSAPTRPIRGSRRSHLYRYRRANTPYLLDVHLGGGTCSAGCPFASRLRQPHHSAARHSAPRYLIEAKELLFKGSAIGVCPPFFFFLSKAIVMTWVIDKERKCAFKSGNDAYRVIFRRLESGHRSDDWYSLPTEARAERQRLPQSATGIAP